MNKTILIGRLAKDNDVRYAANNTMVLRNTLAVDRRFKKEGQQNADFIQIIAFGKSAEFISNYFSKGQKIGIVGRIQTGSYDNAEGKKVYTTDIVVEETDFVESKSNNSQSNTKTAPVSSANEGYFPVDDDGEIPF